MGGSNNTTSNPYDQPVPYTPWQERSRAVATTVGTLLGKPNHFGTAPQPVVQKPLDPVPTFERQYVSYTPQQREPEPAFQYTPPRYDPVAYDPTFGKSTGGGPGNIPAQQSSQNHASGNSQSGSPLQQAFLSTEGRRTSNTSGAF